MHRALTAYNQELAADGLPELTLGIGLERGTGFGELVGHQQLKEVTFTGDTVDVAAAVQDLTRVLSADIIVAQKLRNSLDPRFQLRALPDTTVEGIEKPIVIYAVDGFDRDENEA
jgi:adenylate cyclase